MIVGRYVVFYLYLYTLGKIAGTVVADAVLQVNEAPYL